MLTKEIEKALNEQIAMEAAASFTYLAMASWAEHKGLPGCGKFLYKQSEEERSHMLRLFRYINDAGGHARTPEIPRPKQEYKAVSDLFAAALQQEMENTRAINKLMEICLAKKDHSTANFLQWYVAEQHEEEMQFRNILDTIRIIGPEGRGLYFIDQAIGKRAEDESKEG